MKQDQWTQQLHDKLAQHETAAPDDLWADIEAALLQQQSGSPAQPSASEKPKRARFVAFRRWAVAASLTAVTLGGAFLWWKQSSYPIAEEAQDILAAVESRDDSPAPASSAPAPVISVSAPVISVSAPVVSASAPVVSTSVPAPAVADHSAIAVSTLSAASDAPSLNCPDAPAPVASDAPSLNCSDAPAPAAFDAPSPDSPVLGGFPAEASAPVPAAAPSSVSASSAGSLHARRRPSIGLYAMNGFTSRENRNDVLMAPSLVQRYSDTYANSSAAMARSAAPFQLAGYEEHRHHHQPVSFGLTVRYPLTSRLSLTTGLVYTQLSSDITLSMRSIQMQQQQTLHYVGIPLTLSYSLWDTASAVLHLPASLHTYLSAGVKADWNVATRLETEGVLQELSKDRLQWSLNGSVGIQYDVVPQLGLYAEPGMNWYPDNGSPLQNYFKDKPFAFTLQLGLRLNLGR